MISCSKCLGTLRRLLPARGTLSGADRRLAKWFALSLAVLAPVAALQLSGALAVCDDAQLRLLAGHPFYIGAEEAQVSLLAPAATFALCTLLTLWLAAVLVRTHRAGRRTQLVLLAGLAMALPGLICVLWGGVLYVAAPLVCVGLLWVYTVLCSGLYRALRGHGCSSR